MMQENGKKPLKILSFNWHEPYLCLLAESGHHFFIFEPLMGENFQRRWDVKFRPIPENISIVTYDQMAKGLDEGLFDAAICQNIKDVLTLQKWPNTRKVLVFHNKLSTEIALGGNTVDGEAYKAQLKPLLDGVRLVFISDAKKRDWGFDGEVIPPGIDVNQYGGYTGELKSVLRVGNRIMERDLMMGFKEQLELCSGLPTTLLGDNPRLEESHSSKSWEDLKNHYRQCRVYLNTTKEPHEDGYNLSMLEAMATGMPVVSLANPTSPIVDGRNGFVSADMAKLRRSLELLLNDQLLAKTMGEEARRTVAEQFPLSRFISRWNSVLFDVSGGGIEVGNSFGRASIWMDYAYYPATTAHYLRRALEKEHTLVVSGASMPREVIKIWNLENMKAPILEQHIPRSVARDARSIYAKLPKGFDPDLFLWVESGLDGPPPGIEALPIPKAAYFIDTHLHIESHIAVARLFDVVFLAQREYIPAFKERGIANVFWLPLGCDPEIHGKREVPKKYDIGFAGSITASHQRRAMLLERLQRRFNVKVDRVFLEEMAELYSASKLVFNNAIRNDLNMRVFEALCSGSLLLTDDAEGMGDFFEDGRDLVVYKDGNIEELAARYLGNDEEREAIAKSGREKVLAAHTYAHRAAQIVQTMREKRAAVVVGDKPEHYYHNVRPEVVTLVPASCLRILEVGCAAGETGHALKQQNPAREVVGVEYSPVAGEKAAKLLDRVFIGDSERLDLPYPDGYFDCIIYSDVLEHLRDPEALLRRHKRLLAPDGAMVMSIPNLQHISVVNQLMEGRFTYQDEGLLDRTHIHFFTLHEIESMLTRAGLAPALIQGKRADQIYKEGSKGTLRIGRWQIDGLNENEMFNFFVFQYLVVAGHDQAQMGKKDAFDPAYFRQLITSDPFFAQQADDPLVNIAAALSAAQEAEPANVHAMLDKAAEKQPARCVLLGHLQMAMGRFTDAAEQYNKGGSLKYEGCAHAACGKISDALSCWWGVLDDAEAKEWFERYLHHHAGPDALVAASAVEGNYLRLAAGDAIPEVAAGSVDSVFLDHAIDQVGDPAEYLDSVRRILKQDGLLVIAGYDAAVSENRIYPVPLHRYSAKGMARMVRQAGFTLSDIFRVVAQRSHAVAVSNDRAALDRFAGRLAKSGAVYAVQLAAAYWDNKMYRAAAEASAVALAADPAHPLAVCKYADCLLRFGDAAKAAEYYGKADSLGAVEQANIGLGTILLGQGNDAAAATHFEKAVAANRKNDRALTGLGMALFKAGKRSEGMACYQKAIEVNPENPIALSALVQACYQTGDFLLAEKTLGAYLELHPANLDLLFGLAGVYYQQGKMDEAREALDRILLFDNGHKDARMLMERMDMNGAAK